MVMSVLEIVIISAGLSLDVFVAMAYMGAGFSKKSRKYLQERPRENGWTN